MARIRGSILIIGAIAGLVAACSPTRYKTYDSHFWGAVPHDHLRGKVFWRY